MMRRSLLALCLIVLASSCSSARRGGVVNHHELHVDERRGPSLHHYPASGARVLIIGSPGISWRIFDIPEFGGLAPWLQNRGYDTWVFDWRDIPLTADLNAAGDWIRAAIKQLGEERPVMIVAHGLGGVIAIRAGIGELATRYVFLAVPGDLRHPLDPTAEFASRNWPVPLRLSEARHYQGKPKPTEANFAATQPEHRNSLDNLLWNYGAAPVSTAWLERRLTPVGPSLLNELAASIRAGEWGDRFEMELASIQAPATVLVGQTDALAPPWQTYETYRKIGSEKKFYRFFSRVLGESREYGHLSLLIGKDAVREVYPFIEEGLRLGLPD